jgi:type II secretory ATPase GspE/PulE/Tfp pilus assembly ATPase PilB-like protein
MADSKQYFEDRLAEAELYKTHGLDDDACRIYDELLEKLDPEKHENLYTQIKERLASARGPEEVHVPEVAATSSEEGDVKLLENCDGLIEAGFFTQAIEELEKLLDTTKLQAGLLHFRIGQCYNRLEQPFAAVESFEKALSDIDLAEQDRLEVLDRLAVTQEQNSAMKEAIRALEAVCSIDSSFRNAGERLELIKRNAEKSGRFFKLISAGYIVENDLEQAKKAAKMQNKVIESVLIDQYSIEGVIIGDSLSEYYNCPFIPFTDEPVKPQCVQGISEKFFRTNRCVPVYNDAQDLFLVIDNPTDGMRADNVKTSINMLDIPLAVGLRTDIDLFIDSFYGKDASHVSIETEGDDVFEQLELVEEEEEEEEFEDTGAVAEGVVVQMVNKIIEDAYARDASDIHIESMPGKRGTLIRFRLDGECQHYKTIPAQFKRPLIARIKIISKLDISERRMPQDGKIKFKTKAGKIIELRVATLPTVGGNEDAVMRVLAASGAMPLDKMGLLPQVFEGFQKILATPYGLVLVVGPTGSGKTTTLHAALATINTPERKIWTAEDPVEIVQDGLRQVQVQPKINLDFSRVLRAFLRADPDVIMVGETRDQETAEIVVESSLTGHLVFSTLHTNSAPETVTRLLGMGIDPFNFADSLLGVLAQRLARRLCVNCKEPHKPDDSERAMLHTLYGDHPVYPMSDADIDEATMCKAKGCSKCNQTGYRGRLAVHELLTNSEELQVKIANVAPVAEIKELGLSGGMMTLMQDGLWKVLSGDTDLRQIRATCAK